ncbi:helix-turn-helix transcriptional regulator [Streptomyces sp. NPDC001276]|uniref:helix-turn-helix transcriptional regulator n=1 Tax=Streptomyces sp. NPDC001276 TaxID=3364555 RepID=UPI0036C8DC32
MAALFGSRVRRLRTAVGLTQAELGARTHVVSTRITQIERASGAKPTLRLARALDAALDVPCGGPDGQPPQPPKPRHPRTQPPAAATEAAPASAATETMAPPARAPARAEPQHQPMLADADPQAVAVLAALRRVDPRLVLSEQEAARLAPAVAQWLAAGVAEHQITELLTTRLPDRFLTRPAGILAFRLRETPLPAPPPLRLPAERLPAVLPFQTCDGCERAFRAPAPGRCRDCRSANRLRAAG